MNGAVAGLCAVYFLCCTPEAVSLSQQNYHVVAADDCGADGQQLDQASGPQLTFTEEGTSGPLAVIPEQVYGVRQCHISMNGEWQFTMTPGGTFWLKDAPAAGWKPIRVPGECRMQGFLIQRTSSNLRVSTKSPALNR